MKTTIYTYSVLYSSSIDFQDKCPYAVAVLEQEDGTRFSAFLQGYQPGMTIGIGQEVKSAGTGEAGMPIFTL